jgi:hypothetical protein
MIKGGTGLNLYDNLNQGDLIRAFKVFTSLLFLSSVIPTAAVIWRLGKKGTSRDLKKKVCYRHLIYFFLYLVIFMMIFLD